MGNGEAEREVDAHLIMRCYGKPEQVLKSLAEAGRRLHVAGVGATIVFNGNGDVGEAGVLYRCVVHPSGGRAEMVPEHSHPSWWEQCESTNSRGNRCTLEEGHDDPNADHVFPYHINEKALEHPDGFLIEHRDPFGGSMTEHERREAEKTLPILPGATDDLYEIDRLAQVIAEISSGVQGAIAEQQDMDIARVFHTRIVDYLRAEYNDS